MSFLYADSFFFRVYDKDSVRNSLHFFDTAQVFLKFFQLFLQSDNFFLRQNIECSISFHCFDFFQSCNSALDCLEVGQHTTQPSLVYIEHSTTLSFNFDSILSLFFSSYEQDCAAVSCDISYSFVSIIYHSNGFLQVDNVDTVSLCVDVFSHFRVPSSCLVSKMYTGFQ